MTDETKKPQRAPGKNLEQMTARELLEGYKDLTPEEQEEISGQVLQIIGPTLEKHREQIGEIVQNTARFLSKVGETKDIATPISEALKRAGERIAEALAAAAEAQQEFLQSGAWPKLQEIFPDITEAQGVFIAFMAGDLIEYGPEIKEILQEYEAQEGKALTFEELLDRPAPGDPNPADPGIVLLEDILYRAQEVRKERRGLLPRATAIKPTKAGYPLDKINGYIWGLLGENTHGQLTFAMETKARQKKKQELNLVYSFDFSALEEEGAKVSKRLTPTDKRVYIAIAALYNAGAEKITLTQIHEAMGNTGKPSKNQLARINESVYKMARAWITINDAAEHRAYSYDIDEHRADGKGWTGGKYDGPLLPIERGQVIVNGQLAEAAIHLFREPPMLTFAKLRNQITSIDIKLLQSPASKTEGNLLIEDYLLTRIAKARRSKQAEKILFATLFKQTHIEDKKQRQRAPGKIETYLKYYQAEGFIKSYTMEPDGVTVNF